LFADDAAFFATTLDGMQRTLDIVNEVVSAYGQEIAVKKTEVMKVPGRGATVGSTNNDKLYVNGKELNNVLSFKYVGSVQNSSSNMSDDIDTRAQKMIVAYKKLQINLFENRRLSIRSRLKGFETFVLSGALYGCETWNVTAKNIGKLQSTQFYLLRRLFGYHWSQRKSFADLIHECHEHLVSIFPIEILVSRARLSYFGHVCRMDDSKLPKILLHGHLSCPGAILRKVGGQELNYKRSIQNDLKAMNMGSFDGFAAVKLALDRGRWRQATKYDGVEYYMNQWFIVRAGESVKRHKKTDGDCFVSKVPYYFTFKEPPLVDLSAAISMGGVTVGRGRGERRLGTREIVGVSIHV
jgi:hypothetical protein